MIGGAACGIVRDAVAATGFLATDDADWRGVMRDAEAATGFLATDDADWRGVMRDAEAATGYFDRISRFAAAY
ncbi:MAG: hypothetical protein GX174_12560 [Lentisphaerae bacterium]|nr:hypothetical protein [Lentisphaerota bacterium]